MYSGKTMKFFSLILFLFLVSFPNMANSQGTIVFLIDESYSITDEQMQLQLDSYQLAMTSVAGLYNTNVEIILFSTQPNLLSSGSNIDAANELEMYEFAPRSQRGSTCLANALAMVEINLPRYPTPVIVDISGDGEANCANRHLVPVFLDRLASQGVQVNTLYVQSANPTEDAIHQDSFESFYRSLTRNNGFSITATDFYAFEEAIFRKISLELAFLE